MTARKPPTEIGLEAEGRGRGHRCPGPVGNKGRRGRGGPYSTWSSSDPGQDLQQALRLWPHPTRAASRAPRILRPQLGPPVTPPSASKPPMGPARGTHLVPLPRCPGQTPVSDWALPPPGPGRPSLPSDGSPQCQPTPHLDLCFQEGVVHFICFWFCLACSLSPEFPANPFSTSCWDLPSVSGKLVPISMTVNPVGTQGLTPRCLVGREQKQEDKAGVTGGCRLPGLPAPGPTAGSLSASRDWGWTPRPSCGQAGAFRAVRGTSSQPLPSFWWRPEIAGVPDLCLCGHVASP